MSSVFKVSCAFYWVVWLICLSYAIGIGYFENNYVIRTTKYDQVTWLIKLLCYLNVSMSFVGCIFVKCDVTHILCCFCFMLPTALIVPGVSIFGIIKTRELINRPPDLAETLKVVHDYMERYDNSIPDWLSKTQKDYRCCGLLWYKDYRMFLNKETGPTDDAPQSCCVKMNTKNEGCPRHIFNTDPSPPEIRKPLQIAIEERMYKNYTSKRPIPMELETITDKDIHMKGCYKFLLPNTKDAYQAHFSIYILILVCSLLMSLIYIHNFCIYGPCQDTDYLHSLDVEEVPFLEPEKEVNVENNPSVANFAVSTSTIHSVAPTNRDQGPKNSAGYDDKNKEKQTRPASLHPSVVESLKNNRLRKYL